MTILHAQKYDLGSVSSGSETSLCGISVRSFDDKKGTTSVTSFQKYNRIKRICKWLLTMYTIFPKSSGSHVGQFHGSDGPISFDLPL